MYFLGQRSETIKYDGKLSLIQDFFMKNANIVVIWEGKGAFDPHWENLVNHIVLASILSKT